MFSLLPTKIKIKIRSYYEPDKNIVNCTYQIDDSPFLHRIIKILVELFSYKFSSDIATITGDKIIIQIPDMSNTPYKVRDVEIGEVKLILERK